MSQSTVERVDQRTLRPRPRTIKRAISEVVLLSFALLATSLPVYWFLPGLDTSIRSSAGWVVIAISLVFGLSVVTVFHVEFRREAFSFSLSEVPMVLALVFVAPVPGTVARVVGSAIALVAFRKPPPYKLIFNLCIFTTELTIAYAMMRWLVGVDEPENTALIAAATASTLAASVVGSVVISVAISRFQGDTVRRVVDELKSAWVLVVNAATAGVLLGLALVSPVIAIFAVVPIGALWLMMRRHGELAQRLRDLDEIHGFAGRIGRSLDLDEICHEAVVEVARLLRADVVILRLTNISDAPQMFTTGPLDQHLPIANEITFWEPLIAESDARLIHKSDADEPDADALPALIVASLDDGTGMIGTLLLAGPSGADRHFSVDDVSHVKNLAEQLASSIRKGMLHRQMQFEARHDSLTGLPNRIAFEQHVANSSTRITGGVTEFLLMLDLDRFKEVNDTLGHHAGDDLLVEFSRRVAADIGPHDFFARLAGDEFAIVVRCDDAEAAFELARMCIENASRPVVLDGLSVVVTASVGITEIRSDDDDARRPMRRADIAMYNAKSHHVGIELYRDELDRRTPARLSMLGDLREAIESAQLGVEYQPKLDLGSGSITGAEALVRWTHAVRGVVPPHDFVRVAEETGLIKQMTDIMLSRGISTLRDLHDRGHHLGLSVNLSTHDLLDVKLASRVDGYLLANEVDPGSLTLEITESSLLIDSPRTQVTINELHELGVRLSIDDFGTGYSSLSYLRQLPVRELKIDQSFVTNVLIDEQDEVIVKSTIDLGHNLGLEVVAEGVESEEVLDRLRNFGCDVAQGFCISRPLTAARFLAWLNATTHPSRRVDPMQPEAWGLAQDETPPVERVIETDATD